MYLYEFNLLINLKNDFREMISSEAFENVNQKAYYGTYGKGAGMQARWQEIEGYK